MNAPTAFTIELAAQADDAALRHLLATNAVPGNVTVTFEREPNYFHGCDTLGDAWQVLVARAAQHGQREAVGVACRAVRKVFVNGSETRVGYLGQLRVGLRQ